MKLDRVCFNRKTTYQIKKHSNYDSQSAQSFNEILHVFLKDISPENYPEIGVVGIAGPVIDNQCNATNIPHWIREDGATIGKEWKMEF